MMNNLLNIFNPVICLWRSNVLIMKYKNDKNKYKKYK